MPKVAIVTDSVVSIPEFNHRESQHSLGPLLYPQRKRSSAGSGNYPTGSFLQMAPNSAGATSDRQPWSRRLS